MGEYVLQIGWELSGDVPNNRFTGSLRPDIEKWCEENLHSYWAVQLFATGKQQTIFRKKSFWIVQEKIPEMIFLSENDRLLFKLRWL